MRIAMGWVLVLGVVTSAVAAGPAVADSITYAFEATADGGAGGIFGSVTTFSGTITYSDASGGYATSTDGFGGSVYAGPPHIAYTVTLGSTTYASGVPSSSAVYVYDDLSGSDVLILNHTGPGNRYLELGFADDANGLWASQSLPAGLPALGSFSGTSTDYAYAFFSLDTSAAPDQADFVYGSLTSLTRVEPVPEPATLALVGLGAAGVAWRRRVSRARA